MAQNDQRGAEPEKQYTGNQAMTLSDRLGFVLAQLEDRRAELSDVLPPDITFTVFHATINQALRTNPDILNCTASSIVNACVKAAYDGLRVDGVEAIITKDDVWVKVKGQPDRKEFQARYMPMYRGLVQQVLRGGMVLSCEADVAYENDNFRILRGTEGRGIYHDILLTGDRGKPIAVYNVATLPSGELVVDWMLAVDVLERQKESKSGWDKANNCSKGVWKRWPDEQWKKTVLRRHRKTLPVKRDVVIRDSEMDDEFPQFANAPAHSQISAPPRPQRNRIAQGGGESGVPLDLGRSDAAVENAGREEQGEDRGEQREQNRQAAPLPNEIPGSPSEWLSWSEDIEGKVGEAVDSDALNALWLANDAALKAATKPLRDQIAAIFTDRVADFVTDTITDAGAPK